MKEKQQLRAIVAKRLSNLTEATTHLASEAGSIEDYCRRKDILVVAEAEDLDVSGGKPIRERPKVGPLLMLDHLDEWDVLIIYKIDRGFRNHLDFVTFYHEFCEVHGKKIVSVTEDIDMSTQMGRFIAGILVQFAEWELTRMSERRGAAADVIRRAARWNGGSFPFGYEPYQVKSAGQAFWYLRRHPVYAREVLEVFRAFAAGMPATAIATDLNKRKVPTARDIQLSWSGRPVKSFKWTATQVLYLLRSETARGYVLHYINGPDKPPVRVVGHDGEYVRREPLIDDELWFRVQAVIRDNATPKSGNRYGASLLLQVGFCGYCGAALHHSSSASGSRKTRNHYYQCRNRLSTHRTPQKCQALGSVSMRGLDDTVTGALLDAVGTCDVLKKSVIQGDDHSAALQKLGMQIADLTTQHYVHGGVDDFHAKMAALKAEHERVSSLPAEKPKACTVAIGKTFRQLWDEMDDGQRNDYLKSAEVSALVVRADDIDQLAVTAGTDAADNLVLDIPVNIISEFGGRQLNQSGPPPAKFAVNISLGMLGDQLQRAAHLDVA